MFLNNFETNSSLQCFIFQVIRDAFFPDETVCIGTEVNKNPAAGEELLELCADAALDGVSLVAVEIRTVEVVSACFNKLQVNYQVEEGLIH